MRNTLIVFGLLKKSSRLAPFPIRRTNFFQRLPDRQTAHRHAFISLPFGIPNAQFIGGGLVTLTILNLLSNQQGKVSVCAEWVVLTEHLVQPQSRAAFAINLDQFRCSAQIRGLPAMPPEGRIEPFVKPVMQGQEIPDVI